MGGFLKYLDAEANFNSWEAIVEKTCSCVIKLNKFIVIRLFSSLFFRSVYRKVYPNLFYIRTIFLNVTM